MNLSAIKYAALIKAEAARLGFMSCGISRAQFLEEEAQRLESWLNNNMHGEMRYMENYFDKRLDPTNYFIFQTAIKYKIISAEKIRNPNDLRNIKS